MIRKITISGFIIFFQSLIGQESVFDEIELEFNSIIDEQQKEYDLYTEDVSVWKNNINLSVKNTNPPAPSAPAIGNPKSFAIVKKSIFTLPSILR